MELRYYQRGAIDAVYNCLRTTSDNPLVVLPTGSGKTPVIGTICDDAITKWKGRVLVLSHVQELVEQAYKTALSVNPKLDVGIYSAGLNKRQMDNAIIAASIQSVANKAGELGPFNLILVDEAHLIPASGFGRYRTFLDNAKLVNPKARIVGLTATPYRLGSGLIYGDDSLFRGIAYECGVKALIVDGYLSPLVSKRGLECDTSKLAIKAGEFVDTEVSNLMMANVDQACDEVLAYTQDRRSVIVFAAGVDHASEVCERLHRSGQTVALVAGDTPKAERAEYIADFKTGKLKYLVNVGVLTTGFDAPNVDCVVLLRATLSPGLYYQMVGRGLRLAAGKANCLVLDFGGNLERHGPIDQIEISHRTGKRNSKGEAPGKTCPACNSVCSAGFSRCPECEHLFAVEKPKHEAYASAGAVLSGEVETLEYKILQTLYAKHVNKKDDSKPPTFRVDYYYGAGQFDRVSEWLCFDHPEGSWARNKAYQWWVERDPEGIPPETVDEAVDMANRGLLPVDYGITFNKVSGSKFPEIVKVDFGTKPACETDGWSDPPVDDFYVPAAPSQSAFNWQNNGTEVPF